MDIKSLQEKRNQLMVDASKLIQKPADQTVTAEDRSNFDALMIQVDALETDITRAKVVAKFEDEHRKLSTPPRPVPGENSNETRDVKEAKAFDQWMRRGGDRNAVDAEYRDFVTETRDNTTGTITTLIPQGFLGKLYSALKFYGPIADNVGKVVTNSNGAPYKVSFANDTANTAGLLTEDTTITELDPNFAGPMLTCDTVSSKLITVTWQALEDSYFDLPTYISKIIGERFGRYLEAAITNGNGSNINGLLTTYSTGAASVSATAVGYKDVTNLFGALEAAYLPNAKWVMSTQTRAYLMGVTDGYGRPLFSASTTGDPFTELLGHPIVLNQSMPAIPSTAGTVTPIIFGDLEAGYLLRTDGDISLIALKERYADKLCNAYFGWQRIGGICTVPGSNPIVALSMAG